MPSASLVLLHAMADEAMRYLYVISRIGEGISSSLAGLLVAVVILVTLALARRAASGACRAQTRRGTRGAWTLRRLIVFSRPRARSGGVSI